MRELKYGDWYSGEIRRCTSCGSDSDSGMMNESGVECIDCVQLLDGWWRTLPQWIAWYNSRGKVLKFKNTSGHVLRLQDSPLEFHLMYQRGGRRWYAQSAK